jgi:protein SCO1/2
VKKSIWFFISGIVGGLAVVIFVVLPMMRPYTFHGTVLQSTLPAPNFELNAVNGQKVGPKDFAGDLVLLYFGYTFCPDVCPATLSELRGALDILGADANDVQVIMISVDPARDTPEMLAAYVTHFHPSFLGVTGTPDEIARTAEQYGIFYEAHEGTEATGYLVDHTASVIVIDPDGYLKLVFPFGTSAEDIADDLAHLLK